MNRIMLILISLLILEQVSFAGYGNLTRKGFNKQLKNYKIVDDYIDFSTTESIAMTLETETEVD